MRTQLGALHAKFGWQSPGPAQVVLHEAAPQANPFGHEPPTTELQTPAPLHTPSHAAPHTVALLGYVQTIAEALPQVPPHEVPAPAHGVRLPRGEPAVTGMHVPSVPSKLHAWHCPVHAVSQQIASTQLPL